MKDRHLLEAFLESTEIVVDELISNDLLKDIPVVGTAIKTCKGFSNIKDKIFIAKISGFLTELSSISPETREEVTKKNEKRS